MSSSKIKPGMFASFTKEKKMSSPKNVHIVLEMVIPEDGEQYTTIVGVYEYKPDANKVIRENIVNWLYDNDEGPFPLDLLNEKDKRRAKKDLRRGQSVETVLKSSSLKSLKKEMYGKSGEWSPRGDYWMRPRWTIDTRKLTKSTKKK